MRRKHHTVLYTRVQKRFIAVFLFRLPDSQGRDVERQGGRSRNWYELRITLSDKNPC